VKDTLVPHALRLVRGASTVPAALAVPAVLGAPTAASVSAWEQALSPLRYDAALRHFERTAWWVCDAARCWQVWARDELLRHLLAPVAGTRVTPLVRGVLAVGTYCTVDGSGCARRIWMAEHELRAGGDERGASARLLRMSLVVRDLATRLALETGPAVGTVYVAHTWGTTSWQITRVC
jgi:hypothetical protein